MHSTESIFGKHNICYCWEYSKIKTQGCCFQHGPDTSSHLWFGCWRWIPACIWLWNVLTLLSLSVNRGVSASVSTSMNPFPMAHPEDLPHFCQSLWLVWASEFQLAGLGLSSRRQITQSPHGLPAYCSVRSCLCCAQSVRADSLQLLLTAHTLPYLFMPLLQN